MDCDEYAQSPIPHHHLINIQRRSKVTDGQHGRLDVVQPLIFGDLRVKGFSFLFLSLKMSHCTNLSPGKKLTAKNNRTGDQKNQNDTATDFFSVQIYFVKKRFHMSRTLR